MHSDFITKKILRLPRISIFVITGILIGMSACVASNNDTDAQLSKESAIASSKSRPAGWQREGISETLPYMRPSESGSHDQSSDSALNFTLKPKAALSQAQLADQPQIGTEVGKTLPRFEITLLGGTKKSTAQLPNLGRPVFLFFFSTW